VSDALPLDERYWYLEGTRARRIEVGIDEFWQQLMTGDFRDEFVQRIARADGWLVTLYEMSDDMTSEEMHPQGDELHYLVSGRLDLVLAADDTRDEHVVELRPGTSTAVPRGVWHPFRVHEPARGIAITAGRGTQHRPVPS
jgi:mannose-6-phosphate isomerase-like protein (cupin superfamily)